MNIIEAIKDTLYELFPTLITLDKYNKVKDYSENCIKYNISYSMGLDISSAPTFQFSQKTYALKRQLNNLLPSYNMYTYNTAVANHFTNKKGNAITYEILYNLLLSMKCNSMLTVLQGYHIPDQFFNILNFLDSEILKTQTIPYNEFEVLIDRYIEDFKKFVVIYDAYVISILTDYNNEFKRRIIEKVNDANIKIVNIMPIEFQGTSTYHSMYYANFYAINNAIRYLYNTNDASLLKRNILNIYDNYSNYEKYFSIISPYIQETLYGGEIAVGNFVKYTHANALVMTLSIDNINSDLPLRNHLSYESTRDIFYHLYCNSYIGLKYKYMDINETPKYYLNESPLPIIPYLPILLGIEYHEQLYRPYIELESNEPALENMIFNNDRYVNSIKLVRENFKVTNITMQNPIDCIMLGSNTSNNIINDCLMNSHEDTSYLPNNQQFDSFYPILYDQLKHLLNNNLIDFSTLDTSLKYKELFYNKYRQFDMIDISTFYSEIYKYCIDNAYFCAIMEYKDIKNELEILLTDYARSSMNSLLEELIEKDSTKYNITFSTVVKIDDGKSARNYANFIPLTYTITSNVNVLSTTCYILNDLFCNDIYSDVISQPRSVSNIIAITFAQYNKNRKFLTLQELIDLDNSDKDRAAIYMKFFGSRNYFDINSMYFNNSIQENINTVNQIRKIVYSYIPRETIIGIGNYLYKLALEDIKKTIYNTINNNVNTNSFENLMIELKYYTGIDNNIFLKYI